MHLETFKQIPPDLINFLLVVLFSLLIGLDQRRHHITQGIETLFGTDRTFTLIAIFGFILYIISPQNLIFFMTGGLIVSALLGIFYYQKIKVQQKFGLTSIITALITYCIAPIIYTQPVWLVILLVVCILIITEIKEDLFEFSKKFDNNEFITLAKFLALAGVVLPLLPDTIISDELSISPYRFWLAIVVVSGISYASYLLKKFVFPDSGILLTGVLGGFYSSTATTIILSKQSKGHKDNHKIVPAILLATTMMYIRILLLALFFNREIAIGLFPGFIVMIIVSAGLALYFLRVKKTSAVSQTDTTISVSPSNPLEFKTAILFGVLFIVFAVITGIVLRNYGGAGINTMAWIVGVTDIDPFVINLFQGKWNIDVTLITMAVLNAITSNNLLKLIYALVFSNKSLRANLIIGFSVLFVFGILVTLFFSLNR